MLGSKHLRGPTCRSPPAACGTIEAGTLSGLRRPCTSRLQTTRYPDTRTRGVRPLSTLAALHGLNAPVVMDAFMLGTRNAWSMGASPCTLHSTAAAHAQPPRPMHAPQHPLAPMRASYTAQKQRAGVTTHVAAHVAGTAAGATTGGPQGPVLHASETGPDTLQQVSAQGGAQQRQPEAANEARQQLQLAQHAVAGDRDLYDEVKACETWEDVLEVVADEASRISLTTATQAVSHITRIIRAAGPRSEPAARAALHAAPAFAMLVGLLGAGVPRMTRAQLCNSLNALGALRARLPESVLAAYVQRTQQLVDSFNARDVSQLLYGWAALRRSPGLPTLDLIGFRAKVLLEEGEFEPQGVAMTLHSLAQLDYVNHLLLGAAATELSWRLQEFKPQGIAMSSWALAKLGHFSHAALSGAAAAYAAAPESFKPQETCNLLWSFTKHRYHPQETLAIMVRSLAARSSILAPADYATLFWSLGTFGVHPGPQLLSELLGPMARRLRRFSPSELCQVYWGLGLLGEASQPLCLKIAGLLPDHFEANRMSEDLLRQAFQGYLCGKLEAAQATADGKPAPPSAAIAFPPLMTQAMKRAWVTSTGMGRTGAAAKDDDPKAANPGSNTTSRTNEVQRAPRDAPAVAQDAPENDASGAAAGSPAKAARRAALSLRQELSGILRRLRVPHEVGRNTRDGLVMIDAALQGGPDRYIALQVVMEHEHTCNTGQFLGPLQFQARVLEMNGWEVRHVRAKDLKALRPDTKPLFIADLLRSVGVRVAKPVAAAAAGGSAEGAAAPKGLDLVMKETPAAAAQAKRRARIRVR